MFVYTTEAVEIVNNSKNSLYVKYKTVSIFIRDVEHALLLFCAAAKACSGIPKNKKVKRGTFKRCDYE